MTTTIKITELTNIGANLASSTVIPVVNMAGTPTTEKTVLGNIANVVLAGAGGNYVSAAKATTATTANTVLTNAQPNITSTGNLTGLTVSNVTGIVNFTTTANVTLGNVSNLHIAGGTAGQLLSTNGNGTLSWASDTTTYGNSNVVSLLSAFGSNTITTTGNVSVGNIIGNGQALTNIAGANVSGFVPNANVSNTAFSVAGANVSGFVPNANVSNTAFSVAGANVSGFVPNANVSNTAFSVAVANVSGLGNIATINLTGSNSNVLYGNGVFAAVTGGGANTGNVTFDDNIVIGTGDEYGGAGLYLAPGTNSTANLQYLRVRGGDYPTHIHLDTGNNEYYDQYFGADSRYVKLEANGNVVINADDYAGNSGTWSFTTDGNLILADGNSVIQSIANSSLDPLNPNVSTMVLTPDQGYNAQSLVLDPTAPGHIHLRAPGANIDEPSANIFLGGETSSFEVGYHNGSAPNVFVHSGGNTWTFGNDGTTTFPTGNITSNTSLQFTTTFANVKTVEYQTAGVWDLYVEDSTTGPNDAWSWINVTFKDNLINKPEVFIENQKANDGIAQRWTFDENGNLTLPTGGQIIVSGGLVSSGANPAPTINGFSITNSVGISGNGNIAGNNISATGNVTGGNLVTAGKLSATGNANVGNIGATNGVFSGALTGITTLNASGNANVGNIGGTNAVFANLTGTLTTAAQPNITSTGTLTSLTVTGNVAGGNLSVTGGILKSSRIIATTATLTVADAGGFIQFNSGPYTVTLPDPTLAANSGIGYRFWQNTASNITLSTPVGAFYGPSGGGTSTKVLAQATTQYWDVWSDGYNWLVFGIKIA